MRNFKIILVFITLISGISCKKQSDTDDKIIVEYLNKNNLKATKTSSGLYYIITQTNNGIKAEKGMIATVKYTGKFMDDSIFDQNTSSSAPFTFVLGMGEVIAGWDEGISLMHKGEKARLFLPSKLAYGSSGMSSIPPNTVLQFEVELTDLK